MTEEDAGTGAAGTDVLSVCATVASGRAAEAFDVGTSGRAAEASVRAVGTSAGTVGTLGCTADASLNVRAAGSATTDRSITIPRSVETSGTATVATVTGATEAKVLSGCTCGTSGNTVVAAGSAAGCDSARGTDKVCCSAPSATVLSAAAIASANAFTADPKAASTAALSAIDFAIAVWNASTAASEGIGVPRCETTAAGTPSATADGTAVGVAPKSTGAVPTPMEMKLSMINAFSPCKVNPSNRRPRLSPSASCR